MPGNDHKEGRVARGQSGFTLVEMLIVLVVLAILLLVAAPGFQALIRNNQMVSEVYALRATLNNARSEALARRAPVVVCPTENGSACNDTDVWDRGYMTFVDSDNDNAPDPNNPDEQRIQWESRQNDGLDVEFDNANRRVRYDSRGTSLGFQGTFTFCDERGNQQARGLILNAVGSVSAAVDTDAPPDGVVDDAGGSNVGC